MATVTAQPTPNPAAYKFTIQGHTFDGPKTIGSAAEASGTPFEPLFALPGVKSVFATADFVTITKDAAADWGGIIDSATEALSSAF
ncbi:MAG: NifU N-terminal domain-containing protein [Planctomycetota bacterium]